MRGYLNFIYALVLLLVLASCQREINVRINHPSSLVVVEANFTNLLSLQTVTLSTTVPYNQTNVFPPVSGATVTISSNGYYYYLTENPDGKYTIANLKGDVGQTYKLTIRMGDTVYTASSIMPKPVSLDSMGVSALSAGSKTVRTISVFYHDPPGVPNQYRFILYINGVQVRRVFAMDDSHTDGRIVNEMLYQDDITIKSGDRAEVEMQCIDRPVYEYWYTLSQQNGSATSNSATPSNPTSNIDNGALGYFSAHTAERKSIIVP